jgi:amino acid transporter
MPTLRERLFGKARDLRDPKLFHHISLITFFAWVGLGVDGLSSSAYGPDEAFKHLDGHYYLAAFLAVALAVTVFIISAGYVRVIEAFPSGGGGYVVASKVLGEYAGAVSGAALLVDYVLTITISIASGANAVFAFLPPAWDQWKFTAEVAAIAFLVIINLRGVKESIAVLTPVFLVFLATHAVVILGGIGAHLGATGQIISEVNHGIRDDLSTIGVFGVMVIFFRAYSLGGSSYTGIEAVSNGMQLMREPRVVTGKRTMALMAVSLALTAGGLLLCYMILGITPVEGQPTNALLVKKFTQSWGVFADPFIGLTLVSEGALLVIAAQTGFLGGPRIMANLALDSWFPHQFAALSERLTSRNGVYLMGGAALATLFYTHGDVGVLAVMYSINVFMTFTLSNLGMARLTLQQRGDDPRWRRHLSIHVGGLILCAGILVITVFEKFGAGGWVTLVVTAALIGFCYWVRRHYAMVARKVFKLNEELRPQIEDMPDHPYPATEDLDPEEPTAVLLVGGFGGLGLSALLQIDRVFSGYYHQVVFVSAGVLDSGTFKGPSEMAGLRGSVSQHLTKYVDFARRKLGWAADSDMAIGTEAVEELERLCREVHLRFPRSVFFAGQLIFREPTWWQRLLHNETAHTLQRRLEFDRLPFVVLPVRVLS